MILGLGVMATSAHAQTDSSTPLRGCAAKKQSIERELSYAKEAGNKHRQRGLEKALAEVQNCDDASLQRERQSKVNDAEAKVKEREAELAEEKAEGKAKDIAKAQRKLDEARQDLESARIELLR